MQRLAAQRNMHMAFRDSTFLGRGRYEMHTVSAPHRVQREQQTYCNVSYDSPEALLRAYDFDDLRSFLAIYYRGMNVLRDESDFFELT